MMTWHVVQAQLPPQACSSGTWKFFARSRNDSGLPWFDYGTLPCSNSTTVVSPSMMKVTLGIYGYTLSMFFPASAALTERFIITSARCWVASLSAWVHF